MKFLCICQYGHSRSVGLCRVLHGMNHQAVPIGWATSGDVLPLLASWADVIALMVPEVRGMVPAEYQHKISDDFNIGPDKWSNPYNQDMLSLLKQRVDAFFTKTKTSG